MLLEGQSEGQTVIVSKETDAHIIRILADTATVALLRSGDIFVGRIDGWIQESLRNKIGQIEPPHRVGASIVGPCKSRRGPKFLWFHIVDARVKVKQLVDTNYGPH